MKLCKFVGFVMKEKKSDSDEFTYKWAFQYQDFLEFKTDTIPEQTIFEQVSKVKHNFKLWRVSKLK